MIKLFKPHVTWRAIWNTIKVLRSGQLAEGPRVKEFENEFARKFNLGNVVAVNSGTSALAIAYELAGIQAGDEVISPVLTCTATNLPLLHRKAHIVFADVDYDLNININDVKRKITEKTKAIIFVHFGGNNRGLSELVTICRAHNITLIEDAAQAVGSDFWAQGDFTCVSTQAIKTLTSGDGGFLVCKKDEDYKKAKKLRWFGYDREEKQKKGDTDLTEAGYKYHMNDISAAIGLGNLFSIEKEIKRRKEIMEIYRQYGFEPHIWLTVGFARKDWTILKNFYAHNGIEVGQHHYRNDKYSVFGGRISGLDVMDLLENEYFFVPMGVTKRQAHRIGEIYQNYRRGF